MRGLARKPLCAECLISHNVYYVRTQIRRLRIDNLLTHSPWMMPTEHPAPLNHPVLDDDPHQPGNQPLRLGHQRPAHHLALALPAPPLLAYRFLQRQVRAPAIIQPDGSQRPAARNDRHDAGNLDALVDLSLQRHSSPATSPRHHQDRNPTKRP